MSIPAHLPGVTYASAPKAAGPASALSLPPRLVVIHDTSNTASAANEAHYAATRTDAQSGWTSAHFYVDTGGPLGSLVLNKQAWAAYSYANSHGWHIEMCGTNAGTSGAVPAVTIAHTAALVAQLCALAGIPVVKLSPAQVAAGQRGICGHWDITQGLHVGTHDDPGPQFDWAAFIAQVKQGGETDMANSDDILQLLRDTVLGNPALVPGTNIPNQVPGWIKSTGSRLDTLVAAAAADATRDQATLAAIQALSAGGTSIDTAAVVSAIQAAADGTNKVVAALQAELEQTKAALAAALAGTAPKS